MICAASYYESKFPGYVEYRSRAISVMQEEKEVKQLMMLIGRESLSDHEKLILDVASVLTEDFLQQDNYSDYDRFCPFYKTFGMLRNIVTFYDLAVKTMARLGQPWRVLRIQFKDIFYRLSVMKYLSPIDKSEELIKQELDALHNDLHQLFEEL
jgi:V-type H+-transporting ATPase subunit A